MIGEHYLLDGESAERIYEEIAGLPIFDYHSHLSPRALYEDREYRDIDEMWLDSDHYKWRLMRMAGVAECYITGEHRGYERFEAFACILSDFVGNPVYEWAHMELRRYFDIDMPINATNARYIYDETARIIRERHYSPRVLLKVANVDTVMTTDDPLDELVYHDKLVGEGYDVRVIPTFRVDRILDIGSGDYREYVRALESMTHTHINSIGDAVLAIEKRLDYFIAHGSCIADVSLKDIPIHYTRDLAKEALTLALRGDTLDITHLHAYLFCMLVELGSMFKRHDIVMQLHIGAVRNNNTILYRTLGKDVGVDSIADTMSVERLGVLLDTINTVSGLPRMIVYSHNASAYYPLSTMLGNFAGGTRGRLQLGPAWWMMDSREGMESVLEVTRNTAGLGYMNGMLTDSRSYTSFVRHDYFRRVLSSYLGRMVDGGGVDIVHAISIARDVAYYNAKRFFGGECHEDDDAVVRDE